MDGKFKLEDLEALVFDLKANIEQLRDERNQLQVLLEHSVSEIQKNQRELAEELRRQVANTVKQSSSNSVKQLEAYMGIQTFLSSGEAALNFHGWPISSDVALFLIEKVMVEDFDLIVEFGSGTSTVIFARAMELSLKSAKSEAKKQVVTFEHDVNYLRKTRQALSTQGLSEVVDLVHAPLEWKIFDGNEYNYYACENRLSQVEEQLSGRKAKILVLIDGPPARTCDHARYPALPVILDSLSRHELHIVLDDYSRKEEQEIVSSWRDFMSKRQLVSVVESLPFEKGAAYIKIGC